MKRKILYTITLLLSACAHSSPATAPDADFSSRDQLPQTKVSSKDWDTCCGSWGPHPSAYPPLPTPHPLEWKRERVIAVAEHYLGLPYQHKHIPALGLDCSNFTSWVYNYGFGEYINSNVHKQAETAGRKLSPEEKLEKGDLLYFWSDDKTVVEHTALYIDPEQLIDSIDDKVAIRPFTGWYKKNFAWARRVFEK